LQPHAHSLRQVLRIAIMYWRASKVIKIAKNTVVIVEDGNFVDCPGSKIK
jgi:hypothetical protein